LREAGNPLDAWRKKMANQAKVSLKSKLRESNANYMDNLCDSIVTLSDAQTLSGVNTFSSAPLMTGIQRITVDAATEILAATSLVDFAVNAASSRVVTMPAATAGRHIRVLWTVEQAGSDRVFTKAGSDSFVGNISTKVAGNAAGDGDVVSVTAATAAITVVDDVNIGSYLDFHCAVDAVWIVSGELIVDAVGSVPTLA
jgi:hypothetical protein|tara:strand:- start:654 stop:1250 length:597 start_codon:yes stop_codon:yes gene_type:complete